VLDLSGQTDVFLDFWVRATGGGESRRVYISDNSGASWTEIRNLDGVSQNFSHIVIDLADVANRNGLALNDKFRIRFSYFTDRNGGTAGDGMVLDDIRLTQRAEAVAGFPLAQESFEGTTFTQGFYPQSFGTGTAELSTDYPNNGTQSIFLGQKVAGDTTARLNLVLDLSGQTDVFLDFWVRATGGGESRRVYISDNSGASWTEIRNLDGVSQNFSHIVIDLADVADRNGLALNDKFRVRFSYFTDRNGGTAGDGMVLDDLRVGPSEPPSPPTGEECQCPIVWLTEVWCQSTTRALAGTLAGTLLQDAANLDLDVFYGVRDVILQPNSTGERYIDLYNTHAPEITQLLAQDPELQEQAVAALNAWQPNLAALVEGNGETMTITDEQMQTMNTFLDSLAVAGSTELQDVIAAEREAVAGLADQTMDEATQEVLAEDYTIYLPLTIR
jgi:hypothetical protein